MPADLASASDWTERFPALATLDPAVRGELVERSLVLRVPAGTVIFGPGEVPENLLPLVGGTVRVQADRALRVLLGIALIALAFAGIVPWWV